MHSHRAHGTRQIKEHCLDSETSRNAGHITDCIHDIVDLGSAKRLGAKVKTSEHIRHRLPVYKRVRE